MAFNPLGWIVDSALGAMVKPLFGWLERRTDAEVEKLKAERGVDRDAALELIKADAAIKTAQRDVITAAMMHPVWWLAWLGFVLPVAGYHAAIFIVSTADAWINTPGCIIPAMGEAVVKGAKVCEAYVRRVPREQEEWARQIIGSIFIAQAGTGALAGIVHAIGGRLSRR